MQRIFGLLNTDLNRAELCEFNRKMSVIFGYLHRYQGVLTIAFMLTLCALPSFAQYTPQSDMFSNVSADQTVTSWGDTVINFFFFGLPVGAIVCLGLGIINVVRKQGWVNYAIGLVLCVGGWAFVGALASSMASGKAVKPTSNYGR